MIRKFNINEAIYLNEVHYMQLTMFNVGFGDFFLFSTKKNTLTVDCGSVAFKNNVRNYSNISQLIYNVHPALCKSNKQSHSALLTHFHDDHFSGFKHLRKFKRPLFDEFFIPYLMMNEDGRPVLIEMAIFFYTFLNRNSGCWKLSKNMLNQIEVLLNLTHNNKIRCLKRGDSFRFGGKKYDVIWPNDEIPSNLSFLKFIKQIDSLTEGLEDYIKIRNSIVGRMERWFELIIAKEEPTADSPDFVELAEAQSADLELLDALSRTQREENILRDVISKSLLYGGTSTFSQSDNSLSIVFHNKMSSSDQLKNAIMNEIKAKHNIASFGGLLMMGDVEKKIIENVLARDFYDFYNWGRR